MNSKTEPLNNDDKKVIIEKVFEWNKYFSKKPAKCTITAIDEGMHRFKVEAEMADGSKEEITEDVWDFWWKHRRVKFAKWNPLTGGTI
ncbi:MAG: hypothetical protein C0404_12425 [Verrucomicrobia bacterium]|nr:hypothetical protein [Verrucomicrobiota bacterium]